MGHTLAGTECCSGQHVQPIPTSFCCSSPDACCRKQQPCEETGKSVSPKKRIQFGAAALAEKAQDAYATRKGERAEFNRADRECVLAAACHQPVAPSRLAPPAPLWPLEAAPQNDEGPSQGAFGPQTSAPLPMQPAVADAQAPPPLSAQPRVNAGQPLLPSPVPAQAAPGGDNDQLADRLGSLSFSSP